MKICMFLTNPCVNDTRVLKEARSLVNGGYNVTILAKYKKGLKKNDEIYGAKIVRIVKKKVPFLAKIDFSLKLIFNAVKQKPDFYHAHDLSTLLEAYIASKIKKGKVIYDSHEVFTEINQDTKTLSGKIKKRLWEMIENNLINKVNSVITVSDIYRDAIVKKYKPQNKISIVANCSYLTKFSNKFSLRNLFKLSKNKIILLYYGTAQEGRNIDNILKSLKYLPQNYVFAYFGSCCDYITQNYSKLLNDPGIKDRVFLHREISHKEALHYVAGSDLILAPFKPVDLGYYLACPNKVYEGIITEVPLCVSNLPFLQKVVEGENIGMICDPYDPKNMAEVVKEIMKKNNYKKFKNNIKSIKHKYIWENEEKKLLRIYNNLCQNAK